MSRGECSLFMWGQDSKLKSIPHNPECKILLMRVNEGEDNSNHSFLFLPFLCRQMKSGTLSFQLDDIPLPPLGNSNKNKFRESLKILNPGNETWRHAKIVLFILVLDQYGSSQYRNMLLADIFANTDTDISTQTYRPPILIFLFWLIFSR